MKLHGESIVLTTADASLKWCRQEAVFKMSPATGQDTSVKGWSKDVQVSRILQGRSWPQANEKPILRVQTMKKVRSLKNQKKNPQAHASTKFVEHKRIYTYIYIYMYKNHKF